MNISEKKTSTNSFQHKPMSEINVTPLVDVMLVLLIIFMITAPLLTTGITVDLPSTESKSLPGQDEPITITMTSNGELFIGENPIKKETLIVTLNAITGIEKESRIFVKADEKLSYGEVMKIMSLITHSGYTKVALLTKQVKEK